MSVTQVVLVDHTRKIDPGLLQSAASALDIQVTQHLSPTWPGINAQVTAATVSTLPPGAWPVFLVKSLPPGEGGYHLDKRNQPYAKVIAAPGDDSWTIDASHEIVEMLVDPYGNRTQVSEAIKIAGRDVVDEPGSFTYLVEACDPCEANNYAYDIQGVAVSDFITPHFYDASVTAGVRYSFKGNITRPRQLLPGGYISYMQPDGSWNQILWVDPSKPPRYHSPPVAAASRSWREAVHQAMGPDLDAAKHEQRRKKDGLPPAVRARLDAHKAERAGGKRAVSAMLARYELEPVGD